MPTSATISSAVESYTLALHPDTTLHVSLHNAIPRKDAGDVFRDLYEHDGGSMIVDARRLVSVAHLVAAANLAVARNRNVDQLGFGIAYCAAGTTDRTKVLRDYCLQVHSVVLDDEQQDGDHTREQPSEYDPKEMVPIVLLVATSTSNKQGDCVNSVETWKRMKLPTPQPLGPFFARQLESPAHVARICQWYKLSQEEIAMSSLEEAVLTRIGSKFHL